MSFECRLASAVSTFAGCAACGCLLSRQSLGPMGTLQPLKAVSALQASSCRALCHSGRSTGTLGRLRALPQPAPQRARQQPARALRYASWKANQPQNLTYSGAAWAALLQKARRRSGGACCLFRATQSAAITARTLQGVRHRPASCLTLIRLCGSLHSLPAVCSLPRTAPSSAQTRILQNVRYCLSAESLPNMLHLRVC